MLPVEFNERLMSFWTCFLDLVMLNLLRAIGSMPHVNFRNCLYGPVDFKCQEPQGEAGRRWEDELEALCRVNTLTESSIGVVHLMENRSKVRLEDGRESLCRG